MFMELNFSVLQRSRISAAEVDTQPFLSPALSPLQKPDVLAAIAV